VERQLIAKLKIVLTSWPETGPGCAFCSRLDEFEGDSK
jgi:hypothetical protein